MAKFVKAPEPATAASEPGAAPSLMDLAANASFGDIAMVLGLAVMAVLFCAGVAYESSESRDEDGEGGWFDFGDGGGD